MEINATITMLFDEDGLRIEIRDKDSFITFFRGKVDPVKCCQAFSRLSNVPMESADVRVECFEILGKQLETGKIFFEIPKEVWDDYTNRKELVVPIAEKNLPDGWVLFESFNSRDSFYVIDGKHMARAHIRRWVNMSNED